MKKFVRFLLFAAVVVAVVWVTRERMLPKPPPPDHHPPPFRPPPRHDDEARSTDATPAVAATTDELQRVKGIGPVYEGKLHDMGITTFTGLIAADSRAVADELDIQVEAVVDWKTQATEYLD